MRVAWGEGLPQVGAASWLAVQPGLEHTPRWRAVHARRLFLARVARTGGQAEAERLRQQMQVPMSACMYATNTPDGCLLDAAQVRPAARRHDLLWGGREAGTPAQAAPGHARAANGSNFTRIVHFCPSCTPQRRRIWGAMGEQRLAAFERHLGNSSYRWLEWGAAGLLTNMLMNFWKAWLVAERRRDLAAAGSDRGG